jgi:hypothetical protein
MFIDLKSHFLLGRLSLLVLLSITARIINAPILP